MFEFSDPINDTRIGEFLCLVFERGKQSAAAVGSCSPCQFLIAMKESTELIFLPSLKERDSSHEQAESVLREGWLPAILSANEFESHIADDFFVALELLQGRVVLILAGFMCPFFFHS